MAKKKRNDEDADRIDDLEKKVRELKSTNRYLHKHLKKENRKLYKEIKEELKTINNVEDSNQIQIEQICPDCSREKLIEIMIFNRLIYSCSLCGYKTKAIKI